MRPSQTDEHVPTNVLCVYMLLAGLTSLTLSDGSILAPFKQMSWLQALGSHFWYTQSYLGSIKTAVDAYDEAFRTELDIPAPYPTIGGDDHDEEDDDYPYEDCCYHLVKLYCDRLHDLDALLNPPTMSRQSRHQLSRDWSASWHLAGVLTGIGLSAAVPPKVSQEWAAQLERDGLWPMAAFAMLHVPHEGNRVALLRGLLLRHAAVSEELTDDERFIADRLRVPVAWIHEAKAVRCKARGDKEMEALHWLKAGRFERSHALYAGDIVPTLIVNDRLDRVGTLLRQFVAVGGDKALPVSWATGGELYLRYVTVVTGWRALRLAHTLVNHDGDASGILCSSSSSSCSSTTDDNGNGGHGDLRAQMHRLRADVDKLRKAVSGLTPTSDAQRCDIAVMPVLTVSLSLQGVSPADRRDVSPVPQFMVQ